MKLYTSISIAFLLLAAVGCDPGAKSERGFRLPDGDIEKGKAAFLALRCNDCHTVADVDLPPPAQEPEVNVVLGGEVRRVKTYGELVTSVINPSHTIARGYPKEKITEDGQSKMTNFNEVMTVSQLVDIVAFLQDAYEITVDDTMYYPYAY